MSNTNYCCNNKTDKSQNIGGHHTRCAQNSRTLSTCNTDGVAIAVTADFGAVASMLIAMAATTDGTLPVHRSMVSSHVIVMLCVVSQQP